MPRDPTPRDPATPRMYDELADWFHLVTAPADYADEAADILVRLRRVVDGPLETLLELGSGGGNTASHLKAHLRLTLTDRSAPMLRVSRGLNPECEHLEGDMRTLRLGRTFDAVLIHDAVMYLTTEDDLLAALGTAAAHCRPGGGLVVMPDFVHETFRPTTDHGGEDGDGRSLRYVEWSFDPDPTDTMVVTEFAYLLREGDPASPARVLGDRHVEGLFPRATWLRLLAEAGFTAASEPDAEGRDVFVGVRRPDP